MPDSTDLLGRTLGDYSIDRLIGEGGFSWVFAGRRLSHGQPVALKILKPRYSGDAQFEARFRNEATTAAGLRHPNIVRILEVGAAGGYTFFAMDLYPDSLAACLKRDRTLPNDTLLRLAIDVTSGLAFAHDAGLVHRDIKADNILLAADGRWVITDFGIARAVASYATATGMGMTIGTPQYISPEQAQGRPLDGRSDLYSLGITLYRAATGDAPFRSSDWFELARMHVEDPPTPPRHRRSDLSPRLERIILKCLAKHPDDRYRSAHDLLEELNALARADRSTETFGTAADAQGRRTTPPARATPPLWLRVGIALLVVVAVAVLVVLLGR